MLTYNPYMTTETLVFTLADRLAKSRKSIHLTQQQIGDRLGIGRRTIVRYEDGKQVPNEATLIAWSVVTGAPLEWLHTGEMPDTEGSGDRDTAGVTGRHHGAGSAHLRQRLAA